MRERREVTAGTNGPATGNVRQNAAIQAFDQELYRLRSGPGEALRERIRAQEHRRPDDFVRIRLAHAAGMAPEQPELQLARQLLGNRARDKTAKAGVDAVRVLVRAVSGAFDELPGAHDLFARRAA